MSENTYGVITEVGDLGLGYEPLNEQDQKSYQENKEKETESKE